MLRTWPTNFRLGRHVFGARDSVNNFLTRNGAVLAYKSATLRLAFGGAKREPELLGLDECSSRNSYFIGRPPSQWRRNVSSYARVKYTGIYPGVDLIYYGNDGRLE